MQQNVKLPREDNTRSDICSWTWLYRNLYSSHGFSCLFASAFLQDRWKSALSSFVYLESLDFPSLLKDKTLKDFFPSVLWIFHCPWFSNSIDGKFESILSGNLWMLWIASVMLHSRSSFGLQFLQFDCNVVLTWILKFSPY